MINSEPLFSATFIQQWKALLTCVYGYQMQDQFIQIPGLLSQPSLSYVPWLNYTDLAPEQAQTMSMTLKQPYLIRVLDPKKQALSPGDMVTLRINLKNQTEETLKKTVTAECRRCMQLSLKHNFSFKKGTDPKLIKDFYQLLKQTYHYYGTPMPPFSLFTKMPHYCQVQFYVVYQDQTPIAASVIVQDEEIIWTPFICSDRAYFHLKSNYFLLWHVLLESLPLKKSIFDFGRSGFLSNTYKFKIQWGSYPVPITHFSSNSTSVYKKYATSVKLWKLLPHVVTDSIGPQLTKYLLDL